MRLLCPLFSMQRDLIEYRSTLLSRRQVLSSQSNDQKALRCSPDTNACKADVNFTDTYPPTYAGSPSHIEGWCCTQSTTTPTGSIGQGREVEASYICCCNHTSVFWIHNAASAFIPVRDNKHPRRQASDTSQSGRTRKVTK